MVKTAQAFRPHVMDMFEPQDHPNDFAIPAVLPFRLTTSPAGRWRCRWACSSTAFSTGSTGRSRKSTGLLPAPPASITGTANPAGYLISHRINNSFIAGEPAAEGGRRCVLAEAGRACRRQDLGTGAIWVPASARRRAVLEQGAKQLGVPSYAMAKAPAGEALKLKPIRIGLYDQYGGIMPSGWTRWLFEQYEFPFAGGVSADARCGRSEEQIRCAGVHRRRVSAPGTGGRGGGGGRFGGPTIPKAFRRNIAAGRDASRKTRPCRS